MKKQPKAAQVKICTEKPTVSKIIKAAIPLFAIKGLAAVSVKELADAAGVNIALISYYFGGKNNLYALILENELAALDEFLDDINQKNLAPIPRLQYFAEHVAVAHEQSPYKSRLYYMEITTPTQYYESTVKTAVLRTHSFLRKCIIDGIANGDFRAELDIDFAAISLLKILNLSCMTQHLCQALLPDKDDIAEQYTAQALKIYLQGVSINTDSTSGKKFTLNTTPEHCTQIS